MTKVVLCKDVTSEASQHQKFECNAGFTTSSIDTIDDGKKAVFGHTDGSINLFDAELDKTVPIKKSSNSEIETIESSSSNSSIFYFSSDNSHLKAVGNALVWLVKFYFKI